MASAARGDNTLKYLYIPGRLSVDMYKVIQWEKQLESYKLDDVAHEFLGERKDDLPPAEIFRRFKRGGADDHATIAKYCVQDCALVNKLVVKLKTMENNSQMANVCHVPLSYIFMRGQGIKAFSLVLKACSARGFLVPTVRPCEHPGCQSRPAYDHPASWAERDKRRDRVCAAHKLPTMTLVMPDSFDGTEDPAEQGDDADTPYAGSDAYEGALVLVPKPAMHLEEPITVLDYNSLYPSSMIAENLSLDSWVNDPRYLGRPGYAYNTIDWSDKPNEPPATFAVKVLEDGTPDPRGKAVLPQILEDLLRERKTTRKKMEYQAVTLADGTVLKGLPVGPGELLDVDTGERTRYDPAAEAGREDAFDDFEKTVLDGRQLALKVTANSIYGQTGASKSVIRCREVAACTTATGRKQLLMAKEYVENHMGGEIVYGDSVMPYTPIALRDERGLVRVLRIDEIGEAWAPYREFKDGGEGKEQAPGRGEVWTPRGWSRVVRVVRHRTGKAVFRVRTGRGEVHVTEDHSLLRPDGGLVRPAELRIGEKILHSELPTETALYVRSDTADAGVRAQEAHLLVRDGARWDKGNDGCVVEEVACLHDVGGYLGHVYDLETEEGVFLAGIGDIVVKNTDSIFIKFPMEGRTGKDALAHAIALGQEAERQVKRILKPPQCLGYEKVRGNCTLLAFEGV